MIVALLSCTAAIGAGGILVAWAMRRAPRGYEDDGGFHFGEIAPHHSKRPTRRGVKRRRKRV